MFKNCLTLIRTYVDIYQHQFFSFDCTRPLYASSAPFTNTDGRMKNGDTDGRRESEPEMEGVF